MQRECFTEETERSVTGQLGDKAKNFFKALTFFVEEYQVWHSEAKALVRQLLPRPTGGFR